MDDATARMDLQSITKAPSTPSSDAAATIATVAPFAVTATGVVTIDDTEPRMHDKGNKEDGTWKGSKKKEELVFLGGIPLVDLDDCDIPNERLLTNNEDSDNKEALNQEDMDVDVGAPSCMQTVWPNSSTASVQVSPAILVQTGPLIESSGGIPDPLFNAAGKAPHPDAVIMK